MRPHTPSQRCVTTLLASGRRPRGKAALPVFWRGTHYRSIAEACRAHRFDDHAAIKAAAMAQVQAKVLSSEPMGESPGEFPDPDMGF